MRPQAPLAVVVLSHFEDLALRFLTSEGMPIKAHQRLVVSDGLDHEVVPRAWNVIEGQKPFNFSRNVNIGLEWTEGCDVLLVNDDVIISDRMLAMSLQELAYQDLEVGILSPAVEGEIGSGEVGFARPGPKDIVYTQNYIPFVCIFMRREVLDRVGPMDEGFTGYGGEDTDYNMRVLAKGYRTAVAPNLRVQHPKAHGTWARVVPSIGEAAEASHKRMKEKYHGA